MILLYLDPGSGSFIFQMIMAGALAFLFYLKGIKSWIQSFFTKEEKNQETK